MITPIRVVEIRKVRYQISYDDHMEKFLAYRVEDESKPEREEWDAPTLNALKIKLSTLTKKPPLDIRYSEFDGESAIVDKSLTGIHGSNGNFLIKVLDKKGRGSQEQHSHWRCFRVMRPTDTERKTLEKLIKEYLAEKKRLYDYVNMLTAKGSKEFAKEVKEKLGREVNIKDRY